MVTKKSNLSLNKNGLQVCRSLVIVLWVAPISIPKPTSSCLNTIKLTLSVKLFH